MSNYIDYKQLNEDRKNQMNHVPMADFLVQYFGYEMIKKGRGLTESIINGKAGELHVFWDKKNNEGWRYKNWHNGDSGNLSAYLIKHENFARITPQETMNGVYEFIKEKSGLLDNEFIYQTTGIVKNQDKGTAGADNLNYEEPDNYKYLNSRGISNELLQHEVFKDVIKAVLHKPENINGVGFYNTAFLIRNSNNEIVSLEMVNALKDGQTGINKSFRTQPSNVSCGDGLIFSKLPIDENGNPVKVKGIIVGEAFIDVLSYAELNIPKEQLKDYIFIASYGHLTDDQVKHIQLRVNDHKPDHVKLVNDNDIAGLTYDIKLMAGIRKEQEGNKTLPVMTTYTHNQVEGNLTFTITTEEPKELLNFNSLAKGFEDAKLPVLKPKPSQIEVRVSNTYDSVLLVKDSIERQNTTDKFIVIDKARDKDFNAQLLNKKGLEIKDFKANENPYLNTKNPSLNTHTQAEDLKEHFKKKAITESNAEQELPKKQHKQNL